MAKTQPKFSVKHVSALVDSIVSDDATLVLLVGPPASGKSTIAADLVSRGFLRLSMDVIRGQLFGDEGINRDQAKVKALLLERYGAALSQRHNILVDNTNCFRRVRAELIDLARQSGYVSVILIVMKTPLKVCLERNANRSRVVPEDVVRTLHKELSWRSRVLKEEGTVVLVKPGPDRYHIAMSFPFGRTGKA